MGGFEIDWRVLKVVVVGVCLAEAGPEQQGLERRRERHRCGGVVVKLQPEIAL